MRPVHHLMRLARQGWSHRGWYAECQPALEKASRILKVERDRLIDVLSILSPRQQLSQNVRVTITYLRDDFLSKEVIRTSRVALEHYEQTGKMRGPKVIRFARALKGDESAIVLDTWMSVALGVDPKIFRTKWGRSVCERRIRYGAYVMDITPAQFQAAVWSGTVTRAGRLKVPSYQQAFEEILL